jgi:hypothetical protein
LCVKNCKDEKIQFVITAPFSGCGLIVVRSGNSLFFYHDLYPFCNIAQKMEEISKKGTVKIRIDPKKN